LSLSTDRGELERTAGCRSQLSLSERQRDGKFQITATAEFPSPRLPPDLLRWDSSGAQSRNGCRWLTGSCQVHAGLGPRVSADSECPLHFLHFESAPEWCLSLLVPAVPAGCGHQPNGHRSAVTDRSAARIDETRPSCSGNGELELRSSTDSCCRGTDYGRGCRSRIAADTRQLRQATPRVSRTSRAGQ
jgi:hypothetical protein